jgi:predicted dehydrogenase
MAEKLAGRFQVPLVFTSIRDMVAAAPPDAVFDIALVPSVFADALEQLPDGAAVLIQKPMGNSLDEAERILEICRRKKLIAAVNFQLRFAPFVIAARWLFEQGLLGELYDMEVRVNVQTPWEHFPGVMFHPRLEIQQHSIHYIDLIRSFLGEPKRIFARTAGHPRKQLSSTRSILGFDYGPVTRAAISTNHDHEFGPDHQEAFIKWEGTRGAVKAKMGLLMDYPHGVPDAFEYCLLEEGTAPQWRQAKLEGTWLPHAFAGIMASLQRFAESSAATLPTSVEDAIHTMRLVEAAYASSAQGGAPVATA